MNDIIDKIRSIRESKRINQSTMAKRLGITTNAYNLIENRKRKLSTERVNKICEILNISNLDFSENRNIPEYHFNAFLQYLQEQKAFLDFHLSEADREKETPSYQRYIYLKKLIEFYKS